VSSKWCVVRRRIIDEVKGFGGVQEVVGVGEQKIWRSAKGRKQRFSVLDGALACRVVQVLLCHASDNARDAVKQLGQVRLPTDCC